VGLADGIRAIRMLHPSHSAMVNETFFALSTLDVPSRFVERTPSYRVNMLVVCSAMPKGAEISRMKYVIDPHDRCAGPCGERTR
jgi:hypothetical protein